MELNQESNKQHRVPQSGRKAVKKAAKKQHFQEMTAQQRNPKAFAIQSVDKAARKFRRKMDIIEKKTSHTISRQNTIRTTTNFSCNCRPS